MTSENVSFGVVSALSSDDVWTTRLAERLEAPYTGTHANLRGEQRHHARARERELAGTVFASERALCKHQQQIEEGVWAEVVVESETATLQANVIPLKRGAAG